GAYEVNDAEHRGLHAIPARELRTTPFPLTPTVSRNTAGAKSADTVAPAPTVRLQPAAPEHEPPQRTSLAPELGVALSASACPEFHVVVQLAAQSKPGTSAETDPGPEIVSASGVWASRRTSQ